MADHVRKASLLSTALRRRVAETAVRAALAAGSVLARRVGGPMRVATKRSPIDLVTEIDRSCEQLIRRMLGRAFPDFGFLGEEHGERHGRQPYRWIVDPIDGTNNFVHGFPLFGISIGLQALEGAMMLVGVVYDPMRRELFVAVKGAGARLNGRPIRVSQTRILSRSLLATGFSSNFLKHTQPYLGWFEAFQRQSHGVRRIGTTVLSLAAVAAGRFEGFYERDLWPWDMAAGMLLVEEAGGRVTNLTGGPARLEEGGLVASNRHIHRAVLRVLAQARSLAPSPVAPAPTTS